MFLVWQTYLEELALSQNRRLVYSFRLLQSTIVENAIFLIFAILSDEMKVLHL